MMLSTATATVLLNLAAGQWWSVDDGVMGGISQGNAKLSDQGLQFSGELSLENNGGFSSIRKKLDTAPTGADGITIKVKGDGRRYQLRVRTDEGFDGIAWRVEFTAPSDWTTLQFSLDEFEPVFRGRRLTGVGELRSESIQQVGLMIADGIPGPFSLQVKELLFTPPAGT